MKNNNKIKAVDKNKLLVQGIIRGGIVLLFMGIGLYFVHKEGDVKKFNSILAATIISASLASFSTIYDYDVWTTKKKILIHTICMFFTVIPALIISGWFDLSSPVGYLFILLSFITFGLVGATTGYLFSKFVLKNVPDEQ